MKLTDCKYGPLGNIILTCRDKYGEEVTVTIPEPDDGAILVGSPLASVVKYLNRKYWPLLQLEV